MAAPPRSVGRWLVEEALDWVAVALLLVVVGVVFAVGSWPLAVVVLPVAVIGVVIGHRVVVGRVRGPAGPSGDRSSGLAKPDR